MVNHEEINPVSLPNRILNAQVGWASLKQEEFILNPCVLCGTYRFDSLASLTINWTEFFIVQCNNCGLIWRNPIPDQGFLRDLYSEKYYDIAEHSPDLVHQVGIADSQPEHQAERHKIAEMQVREWIENGVFLNGSGDKNILEIGGGRGYLQQAAANRGWKTVGLEISPYGIREAITKGLLVLPVTLEELSEKFIPYSEYFDLVALYDFLEHVIDPARTLRIVNHILKIDGVIAIRVPNTKGCPTLHLIDHIWHFSDATLQVLLEREGLIIFHQHESGIFSAPNGERIENITIFARKLG